MYKNIHEAGLNLHFYQVQGKHDERDSEGVNLISNFTPLNSAGAECSVDVCQLAAGRLRKAEP